MFEKQHGRCQICGEQERLVIDHDHETGLMRGLLCYRHNTGIGLFKDNPEHLLKAADYLRTTRPVEDVREPVKCWPIENHIKELLNDPKFTSDRARARELTQHFKLTYAAAQVKVCRTRKRLSQKTELLHQTGVIECNHIENQ